MGIQFGEIHNLVRTYQRVLNLDQPDKPNGDPAATDQDDRVSISPEARDLQQASACVTRKPGSHSSNRSDR